MGAWSTRIFDNDAAMDIVGEYKILLGYGVSPEETYQKISEYFGKDYIGKDEEDDYWLSIAYFQWKNGILLDEVKENAIRCIEDERFLERWKDSGEKVYQKRKKVLEEFKDKLKNEVHPTKKKFPKCPDKNDCETFVIDNDPTYKEHKPKLYREHPRLGNFGSPSTLNYVLAKSYTDLGYKEEFWD